MSDGQWFMRWQIGVVVAVALGYVIQHEASWPNWTGALLVLALAPIVILAALNAPPR